MRILRSAILAVGIMGLGLSFGACGKKKGAETPAANPCNPCNPCAADNPCNPCAADNPCNPCAADNPCNPCNPCAPE